VLCLINEVSVGFILRPAGCQMWVEGTAVAFCQPKNYT
jgi:hypothetical protein